jgi:hypothetical protein
MMRKPKLAGVPTWLTDYWLADLRDGCMVPDAQRELHKVLLHKWSGKPGVPELPGARIKRRFHAWVYEGWVRNEIARLKAAGPPPRGGYRTAALETCAERWGWNSGEALQAWLRRAA